MLESIRSGLHAIGGGQDGEAYAPRSTLERYGQSIARGVGQVLIPAGGIIGAGGRIAAQGAAAARGAGAVRQAVRSVATEAAARPGLTIAGEVASGVGAGVAGQAARDAFPGNPWADLAGQVIGGAAGGTGGAAAASRTRRPLRSKRRPSEPAPVAALDDLPAIPEGFVLEDAGGSPQMRADMAADFDTPSLAAPVREVDRLDLGDLPPIPAGFVLEEPQFGRTRQMDERASAEDIAALARTVEPQDVQPIPANQVESLDEAMRANPGTLREVAAPNERDALPSYRLREGGPVRKDPLDLIGWLRTKGGIRDFGGTLSHMGVDNQARPIEFAKSEGFLGRLVNDDGMNLDEAAHDAWEAGFFPDHVERPTVSEFLDALGETHRGGPGRVFHPDDFATIDDYHAALAQRGRVETAAQEGAPLAEDIGQPIGPDDLHANQPPATAYEDLPSAGGYAGNIRLDGLSTPQDIRRALINTDAKVGGFDAATRGVVTQAETAALAREMGLTADDLLKRRKGQALNAEQALAARQILAKSADELVRLAGKAVGGSDADKAGFRQAWVRHVAIQEQVAGATAEAGRALQQFRMTAESKAAQGRIHRVLIDQAGGDDRLDEAAQAILDLQEQGATPGGIAKFAQSALKPKLKDKLVELYYNALLSSPQTHAVNILSNMLTSGLQLPEHAVAAGLGNTRRFASRADRVLLSESRRAGCRAAAGLARRADRLRPHGPHRHRPGSRHEGGGARAARHLRTQGLDHPHADPPALGGGRVLQGRRPPDGDHRSGASQGADRGSEGVRVPPPRR